jgi:hypothetical protein
MLFPVQPANLIILIIVGLFFKQISREIWIQAQTLPWRPVRSKKLKIGDIGRILENI